MFLSHIWTIYCCINYKIYYRITFDCMKLYTIYVSVYIHLYIHLYICLHKKCDVKIYNYTSVHIYTYECMVYYACFVFLSRVLLLTCRMCTCLFICMHYLVTNRFLKPLHFCLYVLSVEFEIYNHVYRCRNLCN